MESKRQYERLKDIHRSEHRHLGHEQLSYDTIWHDEHSLYATRYQKLKPDQKRVCDLLHEQDGLEREEIARELDLPIERLNGILKELEDDSCIKRQEVEGRPHRFSITSIFRRPKAPHTAEKFTELRTVVRKRVVHYLRFRVGAMVLGYFISILWAHHLGLKDFGIFSIALTLAGVLSIFIPFGFATTLIRFLPAYIEEEEWGLFRGLIRRSYQITVLASTLVMVLGGLTVLLWDMSLYRKYVFLVALLLGPLTALTSLISSQLEGEKRFDTSFFLDIFLQPILILGGIYILKYVGNSFGALSAIVVTTGAQALLLIIMFVIFFQSTPLKYEKVPCRYKQKKWLEMAIPVLFMSGFLVLINRADLFVIEILIGHHAAGVYAAVLCTTMFLAIPFKAFKNSINSDVAGLSYAGRLDMLQRLETYSTRSCFLLTVVMAIPFSVFGKQLLYYFGDHAGEGYIPFVILVISWVFLAAAGSPGYVMLMSGRQNKYIKILIGSTVLDIILQFPLVHTMGLTGAALASAISVNVSRVLVVYAAQKDCSIHTSILGPRWWPNLQAAQETNSTKDE
jgi:O-antigen/teichoic acid export membrane protein